MNGAVANESEAKTVSPVVTEDPTSKGIDKEANANRKRKFSTTRRRSVIDGENEDQKERGCCCCLDMLFGTC